ncbi:MAG: ABC transporter ATP-binding protein [Muribaculaceae bacterium]|nr:ABC transporter ATP-binding protein [Muribaculaceae bacterium]
MIEIKDFTLPVQKRLLLDDVNAAMSAGTLVALIGRNGAGKSTFLRAIAGLNRNYQGDVYIAGQNLKDLNPLQLARSVSFVTTERVRIPNLRCRDVVAMGRSPFTNWIGRLSDKDEKIIGISLNMIGMDQFAKRTMDTMSDGECQRVMIARALAQSTPIIMLDEPTSFLDLPARYELVELLKRLAHEESKLILFSTHELDIAMKLADRIALIADGDLYYQSPEQLRESGVLKDKFGEIIDKYL